MLCLNRCEGQRFVIRTPNGDELVILIIKQHRPSQGVRLGIDAPRQYAIVREELQERIERSAAKQRES